MMIGEGETVPSNPLVDSNGNSFTLGQFAGKPLVVYFYPKADTPGCTSEAQGFTALADDFAALGIPVIGISRDKPAKLKKFEEKYGLKVLLASDEPGDMCEAFGTWVEKSMYGRTYMGIARATFLIAADGKVVKVWPKVKVKGHAEEVLETARALG